MAKEIDFDQLFARWGQPDERPCDDWFDAFFDAMRESGRLVAKHEWCGAYAGSNNIWLFKGAYFAENEAHMYGPFDTFWDAADAVDFDKVTDATTSIWGAGGGCRSRRHAARLRASGDGPADRT